MTAYLNVYIDPQTLQATRAEIHTKPAARLPGSWATLLSSEDVSGTRDDPEGALRRFVERLRGGPNRGLSWVRPLLDANV